MRVHYTTTLPQPSIRAAGFVIVGPAGLLEAQQYHRRCAVLSGYEEFSDILMRVRDSVIFRCMCARKRVKPNLSDGVNRGLTALKIGKVVYKLCVNEKQISHLPVCKWLIFKWAQRGMIPRPSDYESAALTN